MKKIINIIFFPITTTMIGFEYLCGIISKGFYFYFVKLFELLKYIFKFKFIDKIILHFKKRQNQPEFFLLMMIYIISAFALTEVIYVPNEKTIKLNQKSFDIRDNQVNFKSDTGISDKNININNDLNKYREYSKMPINSIDVKELNKKNKNIHSWISVDGTNINYPVVKGNDNKYFLNHDLDGVSKSSGWVFQDYRNNNNLDNNTIYYGHNLLNKTGFGSLSNVFTDEWFNTSTRMIVVIDMEYVYVYKIFSYYYIEPEAYYIQNNPSDYSKFLDTIVNRSIRKFDEKVEVSDKIITLSTCTEDNLNRKVVHAKLISKTEIK